MPPQSKPGLARRVGHYAETTAGIALATAAAHVADTIKDVASPQRDIMTWMCVVAVVTGFAWAAY